MCSSEGGSQEAGNAAMDDHAGEYRVALVYRAPESPGLRGYPKSQGNGCLASEASFASSHMLNISLSNGSTRRDARLVAPDRRYGKRHSSQKVCSLPDAQRNSWPLPLPRRNTNEKLLPLELESDHRFMRAFKRFLFLRGAEGGKEQSLGCLAIADQPQPLNHSRKCGSISLELHSVHFMPLLLHCSLEHVGLP